MLQLRWHAVLAQLVVAGLAMVSTIHGRVMTNETDCDRHRSRMAQHAIDEVRPAGCDIVIDPFERGGT